MTGRSIDGDDMADPTQDEDEDRDVAEVDEDQTEGREYAEQSVSDTVDLVEEAGQTKGKPPPNAEKKEKKSKKGKKKAKNRVTDAGAAETEAAEADRRGLLRGGRPGWPGRWVAVLAAGVAIAAGVVGYLKYRSTSDELAALRQADSDRAAAAKLARDYAMKSLNYSFQDPDAFFRSVETGVSQSLKDKYVNATDILKAVMVQAQVTSTGEVLATDAVAQPGQVYQVVVSAAQTTRNMQNPKPRESLILLQVTVNKVADGWQVSDIGPKTGSRPAGPDQPTPPVPGAPPAAPEPAPTPGR